MYHVCMYHVSCFYYIISSFSPFRLLPYFSYTIPLAYESILVVTSGSPAPFLKKNIGLAFLPVEFANIGQEIKIDVRGKHLSAAVVPTPFYKRAK